MICDSGTKSTIVSTVDFKIGPLKVIDALGELFCSVCESVFCTDGFISLYQFSHEESSLLLIGECDIPP